MQVRDYMTHGAECIGGEANIQEAAQKMRAHNVGSLPVCEGSRLIGMLTDRDVALRAVADGLDYRKTKVRDVMTKNPLFCRTNQQIKDVAKTMEARKVRRMPVLDENDRLIGVISLADFTKMGEGKGVVPELLEAVAAHPN